MKLNCAYRDTDGYCLKYSTYAADVPCLGNPNCGGFAEDFGTDTNVVKTNADHIRSMTDEELAGFLAAIDPKHCDKNCPAYDVCTGCTQKLSCSDFIGHWLKQAYKEENT